MVLRFFVSWLFWLENVVQVNRFWPPMAPMMHQTQSCQWYYRLAFFDFTFFSLPPIHSARSLTFLQPSQFTSHFLSSFCDVWVNPWTIQYSVTPTCFFVFSSGRDLIETYVFNNHNPFKVEYRLRVTLDFLSHFFDAMP